MDKSTLMRMFSSVNTEYGTPVEEFSYLDHIFDFTLDVCATKNNAKVNRFFTIEDDGLSQVWSGNCFMNPPFGKAQNPCKSSSCKLKRCKDRGYHLNEYIPGVGDWVKKAVKESESVEVSTVVCILPVRCETDWFQSVFNGASAICFVRGRWQFEGASHPALFPVAIVVFGDVTKDQLEALQVKGNVWDMVDGDCYLY